MAYCILKSFKLKQDPLHLFTALIREKNCFFLDSSLNSNLKGRYSFLGAKPFFTLKVNKENPFRQLKAALENYHFTLPKCNLPFLGGAVGYLAYDLGLFLEEKVKKIDKPDLGIPGCYFGFYNTIIIIDHLKKLFYILAIGFPEKKYHLQKMLAQSNLRSLSRLIAGIDDKENFPEPKQPRGSGRALQANFSKSEYLSAVKKAKGYIRDGDIYQVNLAQQFQGTTTLPDLELYARLRQISPSHFSAYFHAGDFQILSSSPERFLQLEGRRLVTVPMKGTRPRAKSKLADARLRKELLASAKDKAELTMIVDLERNDLGKVCSYASIKVHTLRQLEVYNTVFQTTAMVSGRLHKNKDRIDALAACFPGGSITGCPKIRSMEIIEELEPSRRGIYTGSLGYLSFSGNMDFNILIRTILKKGNRIYFGVGGGIVADSEPEAEYAETLVKAKAMIEAIK